MPLGCDFAVPYVLLGQRNWGKTCRPGVRCPLILIHGILLEGLCHDTESSRGSFSWLTWNLWFQHAIVCKTQRIWFFSSACKTLIFAYVCNVQNFSSSRSGILIKVSDSLWFMERLRGGQGSDPPHAAGTEERGGWDLEVWKLWGYLKADRCFVVLLSRDSMAYISLCSNICKNHLLQVLLLIWTLFHSAFETAFPVFIPGTYLDVSKCELQLYRCWI